MKVWIFVLCILISFYSEAREKTRPHSIGGDYLLELTTGVTDEDGELVYDFGVDVEHFLDSEGHHYALGVTLEFTEIQDQSFYYLAGLISTYYYHYKFFVNAGVLTDFQGANEFKARIGLGKEFLLSHNYLLVPTLALEYLRGDVHPGFILGLAHEF